MFKALQRRQLKRPTFSIARQLDHQHEAEPHDPESTDDDDDDDVDNAIQTVASGAALEGVYVGR